MIPRVPPLLRSPAFWLLLGVLAAEFWAFDQAGARRHTAVYPRFNDQIQYLTESYTGYEFARTRRHYSKLGSPEHAEIEFFNGPHTINGIGTFQFLDRWLAK